MPHVYTRGVVQLNIKYDADGPRKIGVLLESLRGVKQQAVVTMLPEQPLETSQRAWIIINDKNVSSSLHGRNT